MRMGLSLSLVAMQAVFFTPASLFASSEPGVWYDPSDLTTLFQDTAGTQPVTTPGQTVALALDKSKGLVLGPELVTNGDFSSGTTGWASSGTLPSSATVSSGEFVVSATIANGRQVSAISCVAGRTYKVTGFGRVSNGSGSALIAVSSSIDGAPPISSASTVSTSATELTFVFVAAATTQYVAVGNGSSGTGDKIFDNISVKELPGFHATQATTAFRPTYGIHPATGYRNLLSNSNTLATQSYTVINAPHTLSFTGTGTVTLSGASTAGPLVGTGVNDRVSLTFTPIAGSLTLTVSGTVTNAQLEVGSVATAYQTTGASSGRAYPAPASYSITEVPAASLHYLDFGGVDDFLITPTITPGIDKVQVFAGVRKLSDAARSILVESGATGTDSGSFGFNVPRDGLRFYLFTAGGTVLTSSQTTSSSFAAPITNVVSGLADIAVDSNTLRVNGSVAGTVATDQGTGNFLAYPLYIGRRGGTTLPFNGNLYSLIVRFGANLDAGTISQTETWVNSKTGAY